MRSRTATTFESGVNKLQNTYWDSLESSVMPILAPRALATSARGPRVSCNGFFDWYKSPGPDTMPDRPEAGGRIFLLNVDTLPSM